MPTTSARQFTVKIGEQIKAVPAEFNTAAEAIGGPEKKDTFLSDADFESYFRAQEPIGSKLDPQVLKDRANELKCAMAKAPNPTAGSYHNFEQLISECDKLKDLHPGFVKKSSLGQTPEGRDLWMYTITQNVDDEAATAAKPGFVLIKNIHAREWATGETSPALMHNLLDGLDKDSGKQQRLKDGVIYLLACQNPDGREFSFNTDNMWRKTRVPVTDAQGKPTGVYGVDPNRNWGEPEPILNHLMIFDPLGKPGSGKLGTPLGKTSDDPRSEVYRGKSAASEPEVFTAEKVISLPNVVGVNDCHSYARDVLTPWDYSREAPPDAAVYKEVGQAMTAATGYSIEPGIGMYPNSGDTCIYGAANGRISFTTEIGQSFQPSPKLLPKVVQEGVAADLAMVDKLLEKVKDGSLGPRTPIVMPAPDTRQLSLVDLPSSSDPISRYFAD